MSENKEQELTDHEFIRFSDNITSILNRNKNLRKSSKTSTWQQLELQQIKINEIKLKELERKRLEQIKSKQEEQKWEEWSRMCSLSHFE